MAVKFVGLFIVLFVGIFTIGEFVYVVIMVQLYSKVLDTTGGSKSRYGYKMTKIPAFLGSVMDPACFFHIRMRPFGAVP